MILYQGKSNDGELLKIPITVFLKSGATRMGKCAAFIGKKIKAAIWHKRLGHPYEEVLSIMMSNNELSSSIYLCQSVCTFCIQGKMSRLPFHIKQDRSTIIFEKIHTDVWGPSKVITISNFDSVTSYKFQVSDRIFMYKYKTVLRSSFQCL